MLLIGAGIALGAFAIDQARLARNARRGGSPRKKQEKSTGSRSNYYIFEEDVFFVRMPSAVTGVRG